MLSEEKIREHMKSLAFTYDLVRNDIDKKCVYAKIQVLEWVLEEDF